MKTFHIEITLPEGDDEFYEEIAPLKKRAACSRVSHEIQGWLERGGFFPTKVKVTAAYD